MPPSHHSQESTDSNIATRKSLRSKIILTGASILALIIFALPGGSWLLAFTLWQWKAFRECLLDGFPSLRNFFMKLLEKISTRK